MNLLRWMSQKPKSFFSHLKSTHLPQNFKIEFIMGSDRFFFPEKWEVCSTSDVTSCRVFRHIQPDIRTDVRHHCIALPRVEPMSLPTQTRLDLDTAFLRTLNCCHGSGRKYVSQTVLPIVSSIRPQGLTTPDQ